MAPKPEQSYNNSAMDTLMAGADDDSQASAAAAPLAVAPTSPAPSGPSDVKISKSPDGGYSVTVQCGSMAEASAMASQLMEPKPPEPAPPTEESPMPPEAGPGESAEEANPVEA